jgi:hypothetical protein
MMTMIADEIPPHRQRDPSEQHFEAADDNDGACKTSVDPRLLTIARAIGRQIAREELVSLKAANDNNPEGAP